MEESKKNRFLFPNLDASWVEANGDRSVFGMRRKRPEEAFIPRTHLSDIDPFCLRWLCREAVSLANMGSEDGLLSLEVNDHGISAGFVRGDTDEFRTHTLFLEALQGQVTRTVFSHEAHHSRLESHAGKPDRHIGRCACDLGIDNANRNFSAVFQAELALRHLELTLDRPFVQNNERVEFDVADREDVEHRGGTPKRVVFILTEF